MNLISENGRYMCDTKDIENDGVPILLNPGYYGKQSSGYQIGFVTNNLDFYFDTNGEQIKTNVEDIKELATFITSKIYGIKP